MSFWRLTHGLAPLPTGCEELMLELNHTSAQLLAQSSLTEMLSSAWYLLLVLIGFSIVVFFHELGHFLAAKWAGVRVERFAIGFGRELVGFTRGGTRYSINLLPLGGYVKMLGQEDFAVDKEGELKVRDNPDSFTSKSVGKRMVIVSAGVVMNLIFACVAFAAVMMLGQYSVPAVVGYVDPTSAAMRASIQPGDRILAVNGEPIRSFEDLFHAVTLSDQNEELELTIERDGKIVEPKPRVLPEYKQETALRQLGLAQPMNRRVLMTSMRPFGFTPSDELQSNDLLVRIGSGAEARPIKHIGEVFQALRESRGLPVDLVVERPTGPVDWKSLTAVDSDLPAETLEVKAGAPARFQPSDGSDPASASLLGLVPRLLVTWVDIGSPAELAGVRLYDVVVRVGGISNPSYADFRRAIESHGNEDLRVDVRRSGDANDGLSAAAVAFLVAHRDVLIDESYRDLAAARRKLDALLSSAKLSKPEAALVQTLAASRRDGAAWRKWLQSIDVHQLVIRPRAPRSLFGDAGKPAAGIQVWPCEDDEIVVSDVQDTLRGRTSPARRAGVPRGARIVAVEGTPVMRWTELVERFRQSAGKTVRLRYRLGDTEADVAFAVPETITTIIDLPPDATITEIAGASSAEIQSGGKTATIALPDWQVIEALLRKHVGESVVIKYVTRDGRKEEARMKVAEENIDPWLQRVAFAPPFQCYPLREFVRETNPFKALVLGCKRAYAATIQTYLTIKHIIFTREVGVQNISGPLGIIRRGSQIAEGGMTQLIWFLGLISANLAVINFLPMPIVDGGLFIFLLLEKIRGEPVSIKTQVVTQLIGIALIISIFLFVTFQDIANWNR